MLSDSKIQKDFNSVGDFLQTLSQKTDHRFRPEIHKVLDTIKMISTNLATEVELRKDLEHYKAKGFNVRSYLNKTYSNFKDMEKQLTSVVTNLETLDKIRVDYLAIRSEVSAELRNRFEAILYDPDKLLMVRSLWTKIKERKTHE